MSMIPILPESAPFTPAQRAWLNGFLAGLLGMASDRAPVAGALNEAPSSALHGPGPDRQEPGARSQEPQPETFPWHDETIPLEERLTLAEGRPFPRVLMAAMAQLDCGSCGYLCQSYAEAIASGAEEDLTRCVPGGAETARALKRLVREQGSAPAPPTDRSDGATPSPSTEHRAPSTQHRAPIPAQLLHVQRLNRAGSEKDVRHVAIDLRESGLKYEVGDALGVHPENCPELVDALLAALGATGEEAVSARGAESQSARAALTALCAVNRSSRRLVSLLAEWARVPSDRERLCALLENDDDLEGMDLLDLLHAFPTARGPIAELIAVLPPLQPRLYSIASSQKVYPEEVHLTVGVVRYTREGCSRPRKGVASTFLGERARPGEAVRVFVQPSHSFRPPVDDGAPMIMVGPGTGIAPFRAFLQEREARGARGKSWLFFGDQRRDLDFLYREELEEFQRRGALTRLDLAFSRDQENKIYVQHRMRERASLLWDWLEQGAHFYVCGDARRMARDVDQTLHAIVAEQGRRTEDQARAYVAELKRSGRYQRDVY